MTVVLMEVVTSAWPSGGHPLASPSEPEDTVAAASRQRQVIFARDAEVAIQKDEVVSVREAAVALEQRLMALHNGGWPADLEAIVELKRLQSSLRGLTDAVETITAPYWLGDRIPTRPEDLR